MTLAAARGPCVCQYAVSCWLARSIRGWKPKRSHDFYASSHIQSGDRPVEVQAADKFFFPFFSSSAATEVCEIPKKWFAKTSRWNGRRRLNRPSARMFQRRFSTLGTAGAIWRLKKSLQSGWRKKNFNFFSNVKTKNFLLFHIAHNALQQIVQYDMYFQQVFTLQGLKEKWTIFDPPARFLLQEFSSTRSIFGKSRESWQTRLVLFTTIPVPTETLSEWTLPHSSLRAKRDFRVCCDPLWPLQWLGSEKYLTFWVIAQFSLFSFAPDNVCIGSFYVFGNQTRLCVFSRDYMQWTWFDDS